MIEKVALDVFRLLESVPTRVVCGRLDHPRNSELVQDVTREADVFVPELFGSLDALGIAMALRALDSPPLSPIVAKSLVALVRDLYD